MAHKKQPFKVHEFVCYADRAIKTVERQARETHKKDDGWFDGRHFVATPAEEPGIDD